MFSAVIKGSSNPLAHQILSVDKSIISSICTYVHNMYLELLYVYPYIHNTETYMKNIIYKCWYTYEEYEEYVIIYNNVYI